MMKTYENFINKPDIEYYDNGQKKSEIWLLNGKYHRENGPAYQSWSENGQKLSESWYLDGKVHREDGPALKGQYWFLNNIRYSREEWIEQLRKIDSPHYQEQKILLDAEKYNL